MMQSEVNHEHARLEHRLDSLTERYALAMRTRQENLASQLQTEIESVNSRLWQLETPEILWSHTSHDAI